MINRIDVEKEWYGTNFIIEGKDFKINSDITKRICFKNEENKIIKQNDIDTVFLSNIIDVLEKLLYWTEQQIDTVELIKQCYDKLSKENKIKIITYLNSEFKEEFEENL